MTFRLWNTLSHDIDEDTRVEERALLLGVGLVKCWYSKSKNIIQDLCLNKLGYISMCSFLCYQFLTGEHVISSIFKFQWCEGIYCSDCFVVIKEFYLELIVYSVIKICWYWLV